MDSPRLLVIPPTPVRDRPTPSPSLNTVTPTSTPDLSPSPSTIDNERTSSETTIVTIYSMYGEDDAEDPAPWSQRPDSYQDTRQRRQHTLSSDLGVVAVTVDDDDSSYLPTARTGQPIISIAEDSVCCGAPQVDAHRPVTHQFIVQGKDQAMRRSVVSDDSVQLPYSDSRPTSSFPSSSSTRDTSNGHVLDLGAARKSADRTSHTLSRPTSGVSSDMGYTVGRPPLRVSPRGSPTLSRQSSRRLHSPQASSCYETAEWFPVSSPHSASRELAAPSASTSPVPGPSRSATPLRTPPQSRSRPLPTPPPTSPSPSQKKPLPQSPDGKVSLAPSEGEDPDSFHVRNTYAMLDSCGVKGDGYEEGVERTRARIGPSRASELKASAALADNDEKTRDLTPQELNLLGSLDRYGFFVTPTHERLLLLPAGPLVKPLTRVPNSPTNVTATPPTLRTQPPVSPPPKEGSRTQKWSRMLVARSRDQGSNIDEWGIKPSKQRKLRERVYKGIPDCWRTAVWEVLMNQFTRSGKRKLRELAEYYREALDKASTYDIQIDLDVPRTITGHVMFRTRYGQGQRSLFHVLHTLSLYCKDCGYCQGMGPIAATLLCYLDPERVYASLVRLHDSYNMHSIFSPGFPGLLEAIYVQERIMEQQMPMVYAAFKKHMISTTSYATKWYITLFANSVPFQTQLRLWDAFLLEGHDIFIITAIAIVWVYRDHITSDAANFESILSLLSSLFVPEDENALLVWIEKALADKKLRSSMVESRSTWKRLVASGEHATALL